MEIVIFEAEPREARAFDALKGAHRVTIVAEPLTVETVGRFAMAQAISPFIYSELTAEVLAQMPALALIATRSTGFDHIDTAWCARHHVAVSNVPHYGENTVAEHVFALLLALAHRLPEATERARHGPFSPEGLEGFDLAGKTLGVVGTGNIGRHVIAIARGFAMPVLAHDIAPDAALAARSGFSYVPLETLLAQADVVSLHLPATPATRHILSAARIAAMRRGAILINTARGSLVDTAALVGALRTGALAAAGLDVLAGEPLIREEAELVSSGFAAPDAMRDLLADLVLLRMPNVVVTPHSAFNTREAMGRIVETTVANIRAFAAGTPQNLVAPVLAEAG